MWGFFYNIFKKQIAVQHFGTRKALVCALVCTLVCTLVNALVGALVHVPVGAKDVRFHRCCIVTNTDSRKRGSCTHDEGTRMDNNSRSQRIIRYNLIGIIMNCGLAITKMIVGSVTHAQAIFLDGVNSFADMLSSLISVFTTFIGKKSSDKSHPF